MYEKFAQLLARALTEPGIVSEAYRRFHRFSIGNQILAAVQLHQRHLPLSPIASFSRWKELGRSVCKGQKAIFLWMPITVKRKDKGETSGESDDSGEAVTVFKLAPRWFSLEQTEGEDYTEPIESPQWNAEAALTALDITPERFDLMDGNVQGYAVKRRIAVSPIAEYPHKTRFHEIAHVVLGHTQEADCHDATLTPRSLKEVEAEGVAFLLCSLFDLPGRDESRGYIQSWLDDGQLPEKSAQRIFSASQKILEAGRPGDRTAVTQ
ncbi:MAG: ArdC-like ssDNA-binding domain-containing protein [Candidatus Ferrigenium altingense]|nr:MAG: DUF1738 domain-containing protein [Anaerolineaceae bacterium]